MRVSTDCVRFFLVIERIYYSNRRIIKHHGKLNGMMTIHHLSIHRHQVVSNHNTNHRHHYQLSRTHCPRWNWSLSSSSNETKKEKDSNKYRTISLYSNQHSHSRDHQTIYVIWLTNQAYRKDGMHHHQGLQTVTTLKIISILSAYTLAYVKKIQVWIEIPSLGSHIWYRWCYDWI